MSVSRRLTRLVAGVFVCAAGLRGMVAPQTHAAPTAAVQPITVPTPPISVLPSGPVTAPGTYPLQSTASSVTVKWSDHSDNELGYKVFRRDTSGAW
jgi:hypothetical protein